MKRFSYLLLIVSVLCSMVFVSSCKNLKEQAAKKIIQEGTKQASKMKATFDTCDVALGTKYSEEEKQKMGEDMGVVIKDKCAQATSWDQCVELSKDGIREIFEEAVQKSGANKECTDILTDGMFEKFEEQFGSQFNQ